MSSSRHIPRVLRVAVSANKNPQCPRGAALGSYPLQPLPCQEMCGLALPGNIKNPRSWAQPHHVLPLQPRPCMGAAVTLALLLHVSCRVCTPMFCFPPLLLTSKAHNCR